MRKIFFTVALAFMLSTAPAAAQDVYLSTNGDGSEWFIMDETIEGDDGKFRWTNAELKLVDAEGNFKIIPWKFTQIKSDGGRLANWVYSTVWDNVSNPDAEVLPGTNAEKILRYCLNRLGI